MTHVCSSFLEEILHTSVAHWISPTGAHIAYAQFDDSNVPKYRFPLYGPGTNIYGYWSEVAYPKVTKLYMLEFILVNVSCIIPQAKGDKFSVSMYNILILY